MARNLASGEDIEVAIPDSDACLYLTHAVSAERLYAEHRCFESVTSTDTEEGGRPTVFSLAGAPSVFLEENVIPTGGLSDEAVLVRQASSSDSGSFGLSTLAYVFETGDLLDLGHTDISYDGAESFCPIRAGGDQVPYPSPDTKGKLSLIT